MPNTGYQTSFDDEAAKQKARETSFEALKRGDFGGAVGAAQQYARDKGATVDAAFRPGSDPRDMYKPSSQMTEAEKELQMRRDVMSERANYQSQGLEQGAQYARGQAGLYGQQAQEAYGQQLATRGYTNEQLARLQAGAMGQAPSIAAMQLADALAQSRAQASSMAAGARGGPGAQAAALRGAMYANAAAGQSAGSEAAMAAVKERLMYEQRLSEAAQAQRQADLAARGQGVGAEAGMAGLSAQQYKDLLAAQMQYDKNRTEASLGLLGVGTARHGQDIQQDIARQQSEATREGAKWNLLGGAVGQLVSGAKSLFGGGSDSGGGGGSSGGYDYKKDGFGY